MEQHEGLVANLKAMSRNRRATLAAGVLGIAALGVAGVAARSIGEPTDAAEAPRQDASTLDAAAAVLEPLVEVAELPDPSTDDAENAEATDVAESTPADAAPAAAIEWVSPRAPSPVVAVPASERVAKPEAVRGIYVGSWSAGSERRLAQLIALADETEINAFVIDVKDVTGEVSHATQVPLARQLKADRRPRISDMRAVLAKLKEHDIYPIARIVAFKDPLLADARPEWAIQRADGSVWADDKGIRWVDAFNEDVWAYNIELAREAIALGFAEVQWDYVRFPDAPQSYMSEAVYPQRNGRTMAKGIRAFLIKSREELGGTGAPLTADVFGITTSAHGDVGIGQYWEDMADVADVLLPMVYPSHYPRGTWCFPVPNAAPYQIVRKALRHGVARSEDIPGAATIRPWIQAFSLGRPDYTPEYVRAQIDAVYDAGLTEWILWNPASRYSAEPLVTADGRAPWFAGRGKDLYSPPEAKPASERPVPMGVSTDSVP